MELHADLHLLALKIVKPEAKSLGLQRFLLSLSVHLSESCDHRYFFRCVDVLEILHVIDVGFDELNKVDSDLQSIMEGSSSPLSSRSLSLVGMYCTCINAKKAGHLKNGLELAVSCLV